MSRTRNKSKLSKMRFLIGYEQILTPKKKLGNHTNIVKFIDVARIVEEGTPHYMVLSELCSNGHLIDLLDKFKGKLNEA
jgi:serine/threonine protein kinase